MRHSFVLCCIAIKRACVAHVTIGLPRAIIAGTAVRKISYREVRADHAAGIGL